MAYIKLADDVLLDLSKFERITMHKTEMQITFNRYDQTSYVFKFATTAAMNSVFANIEALVAPALRIAEAGVITEQQRN